MNKKVYNNVMSGKSDSNIKFSDLRNLVLSLGFHERIRGEHYIYKRNDMMERIIIQPKGNKAKPYQVKQIRLLFEKYGL